jgi:hypothetical protein
MGGKLNPSTAPPPGRLHSRHAGIRGNFPHTDTQEVPVHLLLACETIEADGRSVKLPGADKAVVSRVKLTDYLLSETHPVGRFKAKFFASLGYSVDDWQTLEGDIRSLLEGEAWESERTPYGTKYEVVGELNGPSGGATRIVTVWIILRGEDTPRFVTAYPE